MECTNELRWVNRRFIDSMPRISHSGWMMTQEVVIEEFENTKQVLQQKWINNVCEAEWIDVQTGEDSQYDVEYDEAKFKKLQLDLSLDAWSKVYRSSKDAETEEEVLSYERWDQLIVKKMKELF